VRLTRRLYERFRVLIHELAKFGVVGGIAFLVTEVGTNLLHFQAGMGPITSNVIATIVATCVSYAGNRYWTFRHRKGMDNLAGEYILFFVLNAIGLAIQLACIGFTYYVLGFTDKLSYNVALFIGIVLGTLFRFWSYRRWVWRAHTPAGTAPASAEDQPGGAAAGPEGYSGAGADGHPATPGLTGNGHPANGSGGALPRHSTGDMTGPGAPRTSR
jgi:putative flippase GtrA